MIKTNNKITQHKLLKSDFIGCGDGPEDLSEITKNI